MRTSAGMAEEGAYLIRGFGGEDVFEFAGLLLNFGLAIHGEAVGEEPFGETVAANNASRPLPASRR